MNNVIGYKGTSKDRLENWRAMLLWKKGYKELSKSKDTIDIALEDKNRYNRFIQEYTKEAA